MWKNNNSKMHGSSDIGPNVPAFLIKLWKLVNDPETDELICWSESKLSFIIHQPARFARELLSMYYKHNNMASFIRQLNMYGFHKIVSEAGGLKNDKDWMEFAHQCFIKDHPYLLENIKRKLPNPKSGVVTNEQFTSTSIKNETQSEILAKVLSDVNNLKGKQESWDARLASMKRENEALWRELAIFRQKHLKQEQIINRLIHFIVTMVQPSRNVPLRRRYPLMLSDIQPVKKITKLSGADTANINQGSPTGPTIHEIDTSDVLFGSPEQHEISTTDVEFISSDLPENNSNLMEAENKGNSFTAKNTSKKASIEKTEHIPEDWLEIEMIEGDIIDPLTPINPAEINPAMAAATLKHLEGTNKVTPISITIPSVTTSTESGKKNISDKRVIYLTDKNIAKKSLKKKKPVVLKLDINKSLNSDTSDLNSSSASVVIRGNKKLPKSPDCPDATTNPAKSTPVIGQKESVKKADSKSAVPELEMDDLEFLLTTKQPNEDPAESRDYNISGKNSLPDPFLKLDSLYNGTICEDQLAVGSPKESISNNLIKVENIDSFAQQDKLSPLANSNDLITKDDVQNTNNVLNFEPESMAIVCQQSSPVESLARDLNSHVDTVQGEIDYLKEILKGEGYNFDTNSLPWIFNDDPLSYGVLPAVDEETAQKKNEETGISGNELMTYGATNLMDLVDMIGSTPNCQDWSNILSPASPTVSDLTTPAPSPSTFSFPSPNKRRKK